MNYQEKLSPWTIIRVRPNLRPITVARFRRYSDAEGQLLILKQMIPQAQFAIVFDCRTKLAEPPAVSPV